MTDKRSKVYILAIITVMAVLVCCRPATVADYSISREADSFNVCRKITVINSRTDSVIYELEGIFSVTNNGNKELCVICKTGENEYKKHFIYLTDTILYVIEDMSGADVSPYHYKVVFYPQQIGRVVDFDVEWGS